MIKTAYLLFTINISSVIDIVIDIAKLYWKAYFK